MTTTKCLVLAMCSTSLVASANVYKDAEDQGQWPRPGSSLSVADASNATLKNFYLVLDLSGSMSYDYCDVTEVDMSNATESYAHCGMVTQTQTVEPGGVANFFSAISLGAYQPEATEERVEVRDPNCQPKLVGNRTSRRVTLTDAEGRTQDAKGNVIDRFVLAKTAISQFVNQVKDQVNNEELNIGFAYFNGGYFQEVLSLGTGSSQVVAIETIVGSLPTPGSGTPLENSQVQAYTQLLGQAQKQRGYGSYTLVMITDGDSGDNVARATSFIRDGSYGVVNQIAVGLCTGDSHAYASLNDMTFYTASDAEQLADTLVEAATVEASSGDGVFETIEFTEVEGQ